MIVVEGALGDGKTDDSAAIQAAIDRASQFGTAEVILPPTDNAWYVCHDLLLPQSIVLKGPASLGTSQRDRTILTVTGSSARTSASATPSAVPPLRTLSA